MMEQSAQNYFSPENRVAPLGIVAMNGAEELSDKIDRDNGKRKERDSRPFDKGEAEAPQHHAPEIRHQNLYRHNDRQDL